MQIDRLNSRLLVPVLAGFLVFGCAALAPAAPPTSTGHVRINPVTNRLQVRHANGPYQDFFVKGANYSQYQIHTQDAGLPWGDCANIGGPTASTVNIICHPPQTAPWRILELFYQIPQRDFTLLRYINGNTISFFGPYTPGTVHNVLRAAHEASTDKEPVMVLFQYWIPPNPYLDYTFPGPTGAAERQAFIDAARDFVRIQLAGAPHYDHVLGIVLGNENDLYFSSQTQAAAFYTLINDMAKAIIGQGSNFDPNYIPVMTASASFQQWPSQVPQWVGNPAVNADDASLDYLQMHRFNIYPGKSFKVHSGAPVGSPPNFFCAIETVTSKPLLVESGMDSFDNIRSVEDTAALSIQAQYTASLWSEMAAAAQGTGDFCPQTNRYSTNVKGTIFPMLTDDWQKAPPPVGTVYNYTISTQDPGGFFLPSFPDQFANDEYWGIFRRHPYQLLNDLYSMKPVGAVLRNYFLNL